MSSKPNTILHGVAAASGVAVGLVHRWVVTTIVAQRSEITDVQQACHQLEQALTTAVSDLRTVIANARRSAEEAEEAEAAIFETHVLFLQDPELLDRTFEMIMGLGIGSRLCSR